MHIKSKDYSEFKLSSKITVKQIEEWIDKFDQESRTNLIEFIRSRFLERYIDGIRGLKNFGFLKMSVACYMIETLQCFKMGLDTSNNQSGCIFKCFFEEEEPFAAFKDFSGEFYANVRCGILHQSETSNAWRILCNGPIIDIQDYTINADEFVKALTKSLENYLAKLVIAQSKDDEIWLRLIKKLKSIITNCCRLDDEQIKLKKKKKEKKKDCVCKPLS